MKKVLIITYYWPPSGGAGVQRWVKFVKYLRDFNIEPIVYIPENPHYPSIDESFSKDIHGDLKVLKYPIWEPYDFYKKFIGMKKNESVQHGFIQEKKSSGLKNHISLWIRSNFFIPDARKFWIKPSIDFLTEKIKNDKPDLIISTGPPHSTHLIALGLKKKLKIPWFADFRDPWTGIDFFDQLKLTFWARRRHFFLENLVLRNADKVIAIGWNLADELKSKGAKDVVVITNGYDEDDFSLEPKSKNHNKFRLAHIGSLNKDRNPVVLWKVLKKIAESSIEFRQALEIQLIGKVDYSVMDTLKELKLDANVSLIEYLPHSQISDQYMQSDILLLLLNNTPNIKGIVTGKLFEYIASGKPVLCIGSDSGDAAKIIEDTNSGQAFNFDDENGMEDFIKTQFQHFNTGNNTTTIRNNYIKKYSRPELTKILASEIIVHLTRSVSL
jgi:glycosyltransferase involved in cell wall biosynthesis